MIPKIIHYCWFGGKPLPEPALKCIASWKKYCPDYEVIEWNETNYDVHKIPYISEAYNAKKYAFVSDYVRLWVIYKYGGIYMDTDVEVLKSLDKFLGHDAFSGFENKYNISTGIMGGIKGHKWYKFLLEYYEDRHFILGDGSYDMTTNVEIITDITTNSYHIQLNNTYQELDDGIIFYPSDVFCPKSYQTGIVSITDNTYCIHHFTGSWVKSPTRLYLAVRNASIELLGKKAGKIVVFPLLLITVFLSDGFTGLKKTLSILLKRKR